MVVVQTGEVQLVGTIVSPALDRPVITSPFVAGRQPFRPCLFNGVVPVTRAEHLLQVFCRLALVTYANITDDITLKVRCTALQRRFGKDFRNHVLQPLQSISAYQNVNTSNVPRTRG